jgi:aspartyl protease family protein
MLRLFVFCLAAVWVVGLMLPDNDALPPAGDPVRATTPSEPPRDTELQREGNGHFYVHAKVNGQLVRFVVDTGATSVALTEEDAERVGIHVDRPNFEIVGEGAAGPIRGQRVQIGSIEVEGKLVNDVRGAVLEGSSMSLLGQSYLSRLTEVKMAGEYMVLR